MRFELATATRIIFGDRAAEELPELAGSLGERALVVTGENSERARPLVDGLFAGDFAVEIFAVPKEPTVAAIEEGVKRAREAGSNVIIAIGGGSPIDAGKAIAALLTNGGEPLDYLEVIGKGMAITQPPAPFIAVPTTAGTGAEVTKNAVLTHELNAVKVSMRSPLMLPRIALVDPQLTHAMPPHVTASTGMDALTQVIEPFVSKLGNPLVDSLCRDAIGRGGRALRRAYENGGDAEARRDMALTSLAGGLALANAKLGAVHGFAGPIGGITGAPHGAICARLLPPVMKQNVAAMREREPANPALARYDEVARLFTGDREAGAEEGVAFAEALCADLEIPRLGELGLDGSQLQSAAQKTAVASSTRGNPIELTGDELRQILDQAL